MSLRQRSLLSRLAAPIGAVILVLALPQAAVAQPTPDDSSPAIATAGELATSSLFATESATGLWVATLDDPSLASYTGGIAGLAATSPQVTGSRSLDVTAPASVAYLNHLADEQSAFVSRAQQALGRTVEVTHEYRNVLNGVAMRISAAEAATLAALPGVAEVYPDKVQEIETDVSNDLIGSAAFWEGDTGPGLDTRGEGVIVGVIDTGINPHHPSFAEVDGEGYRHTNPYGSGNYVGVCDPSHPQHDDICNDKLIGAWNFNPSSPNARDANNHGSHVAGTIAGNVHDAEFTLGTETFTRTVEGVAPRANVISYLVCFPGCPQTSTVAAVDQAISDQVNVLNYSISGGDDPWNDLVDAAFLDAYDAGIFVAASAGNAGPGPRTVAKTAPWNASIAATTTNRIFAHTVETLSPTPVPPATAQMYAFPGGGPQMSADIEAEIKYAGEVGPGDSGACEAFPPGTFDDSIALIIRGGCEFPDKVRNVQAAGAVAALVYNNVAGPPISMGGLDGGTVHIPAAMLDLDSGEALRDFVVDNGSEPTVVRINADTELVIDDIWEDVVAAFSSRGPSQFEMLAPTFAIPGVNILAAARAVGGDADNYAVLQGTSMASPHGAGAGALLMALHPDWSPAQVRSALASTANPDVLLKEDGVNPADPFDQGSGRADLDAAARVGLVMDETHDNFVAANPDLGGEPKTLNLPAMVDYDCVSTCSWTRTVTSVADTTVSYTAVVDAPAGTTVQVSPATFTIAPGATQELTITVQVDDAETGEFAFGDVRLAADGSHASGADVADVHYPVVVIPTSATSSLTVEPTELSSTQAPDQQVEQTLTIGNVGGATLEWELVEMETASFAVSSDVIWEQPVNGTSGIISDYYNAFGTGVYSADDFVVPAPVEVDVIHADGFWNAGGLSEATAINWYIYPDAGGVPAGYPGDGQDAHVFSHSDVPTGAGIDITDDNITLDVVTATGAGLALDPGTYWLTVYPNINDASGDGNFRWNWSQGGSQLSEAHLIDPGDLFGSGWTSWTSFSNAGLSFRGTAFRVEGSYSCTPGDISWLDLSQTTGTVDPDGHVEVTATFDSTDVDPGESSGFLCLLTNDPDNAVVGIPVTMVVDHAPSIVVEPGELASTQAAGTVTEQTLTIGNTGSADLQWEVNEAEVEATLTTGVGVGAFAGMSIRAPLSPRGDLSPYHGDRASTEAAPAIGGALSSVPQASAAQQLPLNDVLVTGGLVEGFDDITTLPNDGWAMINNSDPLGPASWFQGNPTVFSAHEGAADSYIGVNFNSADLIGTISNWLLTPELEISDGDTLSFWTRSTGDDWPDRLEVRLSTSGNSTDVGSTATSVGDFTTLLLEINPNLEVGGYPAEWTQYEVTVDGVGSAATGRLAFRYFVTSAGPFGTASDYIGIDTFEFTASHSCDQAADISWLGVSPASGTTAPGEDSDVTVTFNATGLEPGQYEAQLCVESNDPQEPRVVVPVTMTVEAGAVCDRTITGTHAGPLRVAGEVLCLDGARVVGPITVQSGAGLIAQDSTLVGPLSTAGAATVTLTDSQVTGPLRVDGTTGSVTVDNNRITGPVTLTGNTTGDTPIVVSGNRIVGPLTCSGNDPAPTNNGEPNTVTGRTGGQCAGL